MPLNPLDVQEHMDDYMWLDEHLDDMFEQIRAGLQNDPLPADTIQLLNTIMPYALTRTDYRRWDPLLYDAVLQVINLRDTENHILIWSHLGSSYLQNGRYRSASEAFDNALRRADYAQTPETRLLARIGMLRAQTIFQTSDIDLFISQTLDETRDMVNYRLLGRLHFVLALAYTHQGRTPQALGHGQIALCYWDQLHNMDEVERCALLLAETCRVAQCYSQAERYLQLVEPTTGDAYKLAIYHYQQGALLLEQNQLDDAKVRFQQAVTAYRHLNDFPYFTAASQHALGLVETKLQLYDSARRNLRRALILWQEMDNRFQQVNAVYALGFLEEKAGQFTKAQHLYQQALAVCATLPVSPMLDELRRELEEHLQIIRV